MESLFKILNSEQVGDFEQPPLDLCKKCGRCCMTITPVYSHDEVVKMAQNNEEEAKVFLEIFKKYSSIDDAKKQDKEHVEQILEALLENPTFDKDKISFYYCPHLTNGKTCDIYHQRPDCCKRAPKNGWSLFPKNCGYEGWQFEQRELKKKYVRHLKEILYELELLNTYNNVPIKEETIEYLNKKIKSKIKEFYKYGAKYW